jgi:hypothetical protein
MELADVHRSEDGISRPESKPTQEADVAHSASSNSQEPPTLHGVQLIGLLLCLFLGNFTIGFVGLLVVQKKICILQTIKN